jgi:hypothetical protein
MQPEEASTLFLTAIDHHATLCIVSHGGGLFDLTRPKPSRENL